MNLKTIFSNCRIVALVGNKNTGKTNNLASLIVELRKTNKEMEVYSYGMPETTQNFLNTLNVKEISSIKQLVRKKDCLIVLDEINSLKLNDRRHIEVRDEFVNFVYHNNVYAILCSPNLRDFNSIVGSIIEKWLLKDVDIDNCVNGSQLKSAIESYKGRYKKLGSIAIPKDKILMINDEQEILLHCDYIPKADSKKDIKKLF